MKIIDIHTHTFPDKIAHQAIEKLSQACGTKPFTFGTESELVESTKENHIDFSVILPVATNPMQVSKINDSVINLANERAKGGIISFGAIHPDFESPEEELARLKENGVKGIKLHPAYAGCTMDDQRHIRILKAAAKNDLLVTTHAGLDIGIPDRDYCDFDMIKNCYMAVPDVKLILAHMGGWGSWENSAKELKDTPALMDTSMSFGLLTPREDVDYESLPKIMTPNEFVDLCREIGTDRILFGTDCPWRSQSEGVSDLMNTTLSDSEKEQIFYLNAKQLLGL